MNNGGFCTLSELHKLYDGRTATWIVYSIPSFDERANRSVIGYYEGLFENVVKDLIIPKMRGTFIDSNFCGEIMPLNIKHV